MPVLALKKIWSVKWLVALAMLVWINAIVVVYFSHKVRNHTALLEDLKNQQYELEMEWEALRLEQGTLAEHNRIESLAKAKLDMKNVIAKDEKLVEIK